MKLPPCERNHAKEESAVKVLLIRCFRYSQEKFRIFYESEDFPWMSAFRQDQIFEHRLRSTIGFAIVHFHTFTPGLLDHTEE